MKMAMSNETRNAKHETRNGMPHTPHLITRCPCTYPDTQRAFTLVEVLLAVFILGVGLTMVACIFPVAAD